MGRHPQNLLPYGRIIRPLPPPSINKCELSHMTIPNTGTANCEPPLRHGVHKIGVSASVAIIMVVEVEILWTFLYLRLIQNLR